MITMTEDAFAQAMRQAARAERQAAERRDGGPYWLTGECRPGKDAQPKRRRPTQKRILKALMDGPKGREQVSEAIDRGRSVTNVTLLTMFREGLVAREPIGDTFEYQITPTGRAALEGGA